MEYTKIQWCEPNPANLKGLNKELPSVREIGSSISL